MEVISHRSGCVLDIMIQIDLKVEGAVLSKTAECTLIDSDVQ